MWKVTNFFKDVSAQFDDGRESEFTDELATSDWQAIVNDKNYLVIGHLDDGWFAFFYPQQIGHDIYSIAVYEKQP